MTDTCELVVKYKCGSAFHCGFALGVAILVGAIVGDVHIERSGDDEVDDDENEDDDDGSGSSSSSGCCSW